jgi:hypothetical protein
MRAISPAQVFEALKSVLSERRSQV